MLWYPHGYTWFQEHVTEETSKQRILINSALLVSNPGLIIHHCVTLRKLPSVSMCQSTYLHHGDASATQLLVCFCKA